MAGDAPLSLQIDDELTTLARGARGAKVLVIERDASLRAALLEGLRELKCCRLYESPTTQSATQILKTQQIDVLVLGQVSEALEGELDDLMTWLRSALPYVRRCVRLIERRVIGAGVSEEEEGWCVVMSHALRETLSSPPILPTVPLVAFSPSPEERADGDPPTNPLSPPRPLTTVSEPIVPAEYPPIIDAERPTRPSALSVILRVAGEPEARHARSARGDDSQESAEEGVLVLWVGPKGQQMVEDLQRVCKSLHLQLVAVESAQEALSETRVRRFEVAFVYHQLTDMFSLSLVRSLRREVGESLPIAYVSQHQQVSDRLEGVHAGVSLFLNEEVNPEVLTQSLRQLQALNTQGSARVLVIDDDDSLLGDLVTERLKGAPFQVSCLTSPLRVLELLSEIQTDLLLINADMVGLGGFEVCRTLRATPEWQALPIVLVGERGDDEIRVAAYRSGADDYISSRSEPIVLRACLEARLERSRVVQERADRDGLTGLLVRRAFNDALQTRIATARRQGSCVSVCLIDLDHFKSVNDTYGHIAGDRVLSMMGRLLSSSFRVEDLRGRWGGEEFVVAFSNEDAKSAKVILERARREFVRLYFDGESGERFQSSFSAGVATFPESGQTIEDLFKVADERLYRVKEAGRNQILAADNFGELSGGGGEEG